MEKIWEELKKIEGQAELIRSDARDNAKKMTDAAQKEAEELFANSITYAGEEAQQLYMSTIQEANSSRDQKLKLNEAATETLKKQAEKHMKTAISKVVNSVIEEKSP